MEKIARGIFSYLYFSVLYSNMNYVPPVQYINMFQ